MPDDLGVKYGPSGQIALSREALQANVPLRAASLAEAAAEACDLATGR